MTRNNFYCIAFLLLNLNSLIKIVFYANQLIFDYIYFANLFAKKFSNGIEKGIHKLKQMLIS